MSVLASQTRKKIDTHYNMNFGECYGQGVATPVPSTLILPIMTACKYHTHSARISIIKG